MKLIKELQEDVEYLVENTSQGKQYYIEGQFLSADVTNRNGRVYPQNVMEAAVNKFQQDYIRANRAMGELGHPPNPQVNLDRVSHVIKSLDFDKAKKGAVIGKAHIIDTPMGKIAKSLIDAGVKLGVSSRGLGSIKTINGVNYVQEDFTLNTVDIVSDPSGPGCFVSGIMENAEWVQNSSGDWIQIAVDLNKNRIDESVALKEFSRLMTMLKG